MNNVKKYFEDVTKVMAAISVKDTTFACSLVKSTINSGAKIITCGNGGSAYAASHYITDWNKMYNLHNGEMIKGISLCDNIGLITAYANDINFDQIFSGQLKAIGEPNDLLIVVSGSGNSPNVVSALQTAKDMGIKSLALVGYDGGKCGMMSDYKVHIPSFDMQICEDIHVMLGHIIMKYICQND
jgi:D-sedoheptulose 7-phosphate isomerase